MHTRNIATKHISVQAAPPSIPFSVAFAMIWQVSNKKLTPELEAKIEEWLSKKPKHEVALPDNSTNRRTNCIIILAESLESWVLEKEVEGQEITPYLNKLLKDSTTIYAPHVLTQVKGGRSIDAQLILCTGLLPINSGTYSSQYPNHVYPSLQKAMHEKKSFAQLSVNHR